MWYTRIASMACNDFGVDFGVALPWQRCVQVMHKCHQFLDQLSSTTNWAPQFLSLPASSPTSACKTHPANRGTRNEKEHTSTWKHDEMTDWTVIAACLNKIMLRKTANIPNGHAACTWWFKRCQCAALQIISFSLDSKPLFLVKASLSQNLSNRIWHLKSHLCFPP